MLVGELATADRPEGTRQGPQNLSCGASIRIAPERCLYGGGARRAQAAR
jgi:hypothetical protein